MDEPLQRYVPLLGRILLSAIFIWSGIGKITGFSGNEAYMAAHGMPLIPVLLTIALIIELGGGLMILLGWHARLAALVLFLYTIPTTLIFHAFWAVPPAQVQDMQIHFMKNLAMMGGLLYVVAYGAGELSMDNSVRRRGLLA